jgi:hypothetical protein
MIRLSGPRCLAMSVVGTLFGWWAAQDNVSTMARYRELDHEALLAELASQNTGTLSTDIMGGVIVVLGVVLMVDALTRFFNAIWARIERPNTRGHGPDTPVAAV